MRTQVGIIGSGPAGLLLGQLLHCYGIDSVIVENQSREHVIERVRAGVLEQGTVDLMTAIGAGARLERECLRHGGIYISFGGQRRHIDFGALVGRSITVYGQNEVVKDLIEIRKQTGRPLFFEAGNVRVRDLDSPAPAVLFEKDGAGQEWTCDFIAGCDGFHGVSRQSIPPHALSIYERVYPFGWLGILAEAPPASDELVYSSHDRGFALFSMRSPRITRLYLQCDPDDDIARWPDDRIWQELRVRLESDDGWKPNEGRILQKSVTGMRSFVVEPMRYGRLFLAGDAAHIVPPTGAKGLNLAAADVRVLAHALAEYYRTGSETGLDAYSEKCLRRVWLAQRFSWWMTSMLHRSDADTAFDRRRQLAELDYVTSSTAAMTSLAENYTGLPLDVALNF